MTDLRTAPSDPEASAPPARWRSPALLAVVVAMALAGVLVLVLAVSGGGASGVQAGPGPQPEQDDRGGVTDEGGSTSAEQREPSSTAVQDAPEGYPFPETSFWRDDLRDAPVHDNSEAIVGHLADSVAAHYDGVATFNLDQYNVAYYEVDQSAPTYDVAFDDCQDKGGTPDGLYDGDAHFADVPIPDGARPAEGNDGALVIHSPTTDQLWEFWRASPTDDGWQACWGGRIDDVSTSPGYFDGNFGTTATGLSHAGGMISLDDVRAGRIDHAVALLAVEPATYKTYSWPAQRSDGYSDDEDAVPEGLRLRLPADVDVASLDLHPLAEMVALAAQKHGFVIVDKAGATGVYTESGAAVEAETGQDPWDEYLEGTPSYEVMRDFPWDELEALPMDHGER